MTCERARERGMDLLVEVCLPNHPPHAGDLRVVERHGVKLIACAATGRILTRFLDEIPP